MKRSMNVIIGPVTLGAMMFALTGCGEGEYEEVPADSQEICVERDTGERVDFDKCDSDTSHIHYYPWYHASTYGGAPAVGSKVNPAHGSTVKPDGSFARPPETGGFGGFRAPVGS